MKAAEANPTRSPLLTERFVLEPTPIAGVWHVSHKPIVDARGHFTRLYCAAELKSAGLADNVAQINSSYSKAAGTVRGLHYQHPPHEETKIISCTRGAIFDVAVDLRPTSPSFLQWHGVTLSDSNHKALIVPHGVAHGYQTLCDDTEILYFVTAPYSSQAEDGLNPLDPSLAIEWPIKVTEISPRDAQRHLLDVSISRRLNKLALLSPDVA